MTKVLLLHAMYSTPSDHWYPWLKRELAKRAVDTTIPELPNSSNPKFTDWWECALKDFTIDTDTTIIGHSLGTILAMRFAEKFSFSRLLLVSGWDYWDLVDEYKTFFEKPINHSIIIKNVSQSVCFYSNEDPYDTIMHYEALANRLKAKKMYIPGNKHFREEDGCSSFQKGQCESKASLLSLIDPVENVLLAVIFLSEIPTLGTAIGGILILFSIVFSSRK